MPKSDSTMLAYLLTIMETLCRGCGGVPLTTPKIFCQADTSDMFVSIKEIRSQFPEAAIFAVGFSLGGYTLNKYVGQVDTGVYSPGTAQKLHSISGPMANLMTTEASSRHTSFFTEHTPSQPGDEAFVLS